MIYVTGDTHAHIDIQKLNTKRFPEQKNLTKDDYLIVCGDFGLVWDESPEERYWRKWLDDKPFTTLWIDGNHENFELLKEFPVINKFGGKVQKISDSIFHLMRGEIYTIEGKTLFCMGGASSIDKELRVPNKSWWEEEIPSSSELNYGLNNLEKNNNEVDIILSHCMPTSVIYKHFGKSYKNDTLTDYFDIIKSKVKYKHWYCGHYHCDEKLDDNITILYHKVLKLE